MNTKKIAKTLTVIINLLADRKFEELHNIDAEKLLPAGDIPEFLDDYGGTVTLPRTDQWEYDFYPIDGTDEIFIDYDLMIDNKTSDLTLQVKMADGDDEIYAFAIQSIHIL